METAFIRDKRGDFVRARSGIWTQRDTEKRPREDGGRGWRCAALYKPSGAQSHWKPEEARERSSLCLQREQTLPAL